MSHIQPPSPPGPLPDSLSDIMALRVEPTSLALESILDNPSHKGDLVVPMTEEVPVLSASKKDSSTRALPPFAVSETKRKSVATASKMRCPASGCKKWGMEEELACHWRNAHECQVVLWLCPMPRCNQRFWSAVQLSIHLRKCHRWVTPIGGFGGQQHLQFSRRCQTLLCHGTNFATGSLGASYEGDTTGWGGGHPEGETCREHHRWEGSVVFVSGGL